MKKSYLKNIIAVFLLVAFSLTGVSSGTFYCVSDCCQTTGKSCCDQSDKKESISKTGCCEYAQNSQTEKKAVASVIKSNILSSPLSLILKTSFNISNTNFFSSGFTCGHRKKSQSITILRI